MKVNCKWVAIIIASLLISDLSAQSIAIDARKVSTQVQSGHLKMGNPGPDGKKLEANSGYLTLDGKPILPVMGEIHYSRVEPDRWEEMILKMKANGINIIAFYAIWIHHEETEGEFLWTGRYDLRRFVELCKKHKVYAYPRLGPWVHGEVRNGGLPDWLMKKEGMRLRTNAENYQFYANRWYNEIGKQLEGLYYKDGGPIIGVQLENEYWRGKGGEAHILWLKETALKYGMDVPLYTITGWRNTSTPALEVIPLWGGYPAAPWNTDLKKITHNESYLFTKPVNDQSIGNRDDARKYTPDYSPYPYLTCELGVGNQLSEHRRPVIDPIDGATIALSKIASGSNLPGYYVFTGGLNPVGKYTTLEEDKLESGYWNEYPDISYDFQAAIGESGEIRKSYQKLKPLHYFLNAFGNRLAPMKPVLPAENIHPDSLQVALRSDGKSGFLFVSNYYRGHQKSTKKGVQFQIQLEDESLHVPENPVDIKDSVAFIWPINMPLGEVILQQSTTQPITWVDNGKTTDWYFKASGEIRIQYAFKADGIQHIKYGRSSIAKNEDRFLVKSAESGLATPITLQTTNGAVHRIFTLSEKEADQFWWFKSGDKTFAFLSDANLTMDENQQLMLNSTASTQTVIALNSKLSKLEKGAKAKQVNGFQQWQISHPTKEYTLNIEKEDVLDKAQWLNTAAENYSAKRLLYNQLFYRELDLSNTAEIRKASLYIVSQSSCSIRINDRWLNQEIKTEEVNRIDLTGYLKNSKNHIYLCLPYKAEKSAMAFALEVEFFNADKRVMVSDTTWLSAESYKIPPVWEGLGRAASAKTMERPEAFAELAFTPNRYRIWVNEGVPTREVYARLHYIGDKARMYNNERLVADNYNNQTTWNIHLPTLFKRGTEAVLEIDPLPADYRIYFDIPPKPENLGKAEVKSLRLEETFHTQFLVE